MYNPLYIKTDYSLLSSLIKIDNLILNCKEKNITSLAIVDNNLFGTMEFITKCKNNDIKPIIGLEITLNNNSVLLYAKNLNGYYNLVKIETIKNEQELTLEILEKYNSDLICICFKEDIYSLLTKIFNDTFFGVSNKIEEKDKKNVVFVNKTLYLQKYEYKYLPYLFMIRDGKTIEDGIEFIYQNNHLMDYEEVTQLVSATAINNTLKIADMCNIEFKKEIFMPKYPVEDSKRFLIDLANKGLKRRLNNNVTEEYQKRLNYELDIIMKMHFEDYFLVVYDYIKYAKKNNILVGPGRGSAAGSLVCYSLGITDVDSIKYDLLFERFLNPERITMPDIDTDFPDIDRDKVIEYVKNLYGERKVAGIITFGTLKTKQAIRDVGRILNISMNDVDYLCKKIKMNESLKDLKKRSLEVSNFLESEDKFKLLYNIVNLIHENKRHTSIHAAGMVISYKNLDEILPIIKNNDLYLTEYSMEYLENLGLIKMDFLGLKNLSIIKDVITDIKRDLKIEIDFNKIPLDDQKAIEIFKKADTIGIFQFESDGMKKFLTDLKPNNFSEICAAIALFRPGPAENIPTFIKRKDGKEKVTYITDSLENILKDTYGIIIYQEQIMQIANVMANYNLGEADLLRRAMSKKKYELLKNEEEKFITNSIKNGYSKEKSKEVYDLILKFANYGFNKSHSISYSLIAYKMAYLKAYYPKYFYCSLLKGVIGSESKTFEYIQELKKLDIKILPPNINISDDYNYVIKEEGIYLPLSTIRNVGGVIANYIKEERQNGLYKSVFDFLRRTYKKTNNKKVIESLIYSHCFDEFYNITTIINNLEKITNYVELSVDLDENMLEAPEIDIFENNIDDILEKEKELFGFYLTSHKTEKYKLMYKNIIDVSEIQKYLNKNINLIVNIDRIKEIKTKKGDNMCFITGSDSTGTISITMFPKIYDELIKQEIKRSSIILINGKIEKRFNEYQLITEKIKKLN